MLELDEYKLKYERWLREFPGSERECPDFSTWMMRYYPMPAKTDREVEYHNAESMKTMVKRACEFRLILNSQRLALRMFANTYKNYEQRREIMRHNKQMQMERLGHLRAKIRLIRQIFIERKTNARTTK